METNWTKADFKNFGKLQGMPGDLTQLANEALARELSVNLSAFLRSSLTATYGKGVQTLFGDLSLSDRSSCFGLALLGPDDRKLLVELENTALFPLLGLALGAKAGSFPSPERKPTEIELQVVQLLFRRILPEVCRVWSTLVKRPLEIVTLDIEPTPARTLPVTEPMFVAPFQLSGDEPLGLLRLIAPYDLFAGAAEEQDLPRREPLQTGASAENMVELMLRVRVEVEVWVEGSHMLLKDLLQLREGQIIKLDHPVERRVSCTLNGKPGFSGQIVSTGTRRAFLVEEFPG
jgi:flagellar motor switch protein FliM